MKSLVMVRMTMSRPIVIIATAKSGSPIIGRIVEPLDDDAQRAPCASDRDDRRERSTAADRTERSRASGPGS